MAGKQQVAELTAEIRALREELARVRADQASHSCFHYHYTPIPWQPTAPAQWYQPLSTPFVTCAMTTSVAAGVPNITTMVLNTAGSN